MAKESLRDRVERWRHSRRVMVLVGLGLLVLLIYVFARMRPLAPGSIRILTGPEGSHYHAVGERFVKELGKHGIKATLVATGGALDNLKRLKAEDDDVIALASSQIERELGPSADLDHLVSLGSLAYEPYWLFTRPDLPFRQVGDLAGHTVALGPPGSSSRAIAHLLLEENGVADRVDTAAFEDLASEEIAERLLDGEVDAAFLSGSTQVSPVNRLLASGVVRPRSIERAGTYAALFGGLARFEVPEGALDLAKNLPDTPLLTLTGTTTILAHEDLHGAMVEVIINTARDLQPHHSLESPQGTFPSPQHVSFPLDPRARRFYEDGPSRLSGDLPYWGAALVDQVVFVLLPALAILFTILKVVPTLLGLRFTLRRVSLNRKMLQVERDLIGGTDASRLLEALDEVDRVSARMQVPPNKAGDYLELRQNLHDARERIADARRNG